MKPKPQKNQGKFNKKHARADQKKKPNFKQKDKIKLQKSVCENNSTKVTSCQKFFCIVY